MPTEEEELLEIRLSEEEEARRAELLKIGLSEEEKARRAETSPSHIDSGEEEKPFTKKPEEPPPKPEPLQEALKAKPPPIEYPADLKPYEIAIINNWSDEQKKEFFNWREKARKRREEEQSSYESSQAAAQKARGEAYESRSPGASVARLAAEREEALREKGLKAISERQQEVAKIKAAGDLAVEKEKGAQEEAEQLETGLQKEWARKSKAVMKVWEGLSKPNKDLFRKAEAAWSASLLTKDVGQRGQARKPAIEAMETLQAAVDEATPKSIAELSNGAFQEFFPGANAGRVTSGPLQGRTWRRDKDGINLDPQVQDLAAEAALKAVEQTRKEEEKKAKKIKEETDLKLEIFTKVMPLYTKMEGEIKTVDMESAWKETEKILERLRAPAPTAPAPTTPAPAPQTKEQAAKPKTPAEVQAQAEQEKLPILTPEQVKAAPPGTAFLTPEGKKRMKE